MGKTIYFFYFFWGPEAMPLSPKKKEKEKEKKEKEKEKKKRNNPQPTHSFKI